MVAFLWLYLLFLHHSKLFHHSCSIAENDLGEQSIHALSEGLPCFRHLRKIEWVPGRGGRAGRTWGCAPHSSDTSTSCPVCSLPAASAWNSVGSLMMLQNHSLLASNSALPWRRSCECGDGWGGTSAHTGHSSFFNVCSCLEVQGTSHPAEFLLKVFSNTFYRVHFGGKCTNNLLIDEIHC